MASELRNVVEGSTARCQVLTGEILQHGHHDLERAVPADTDNEAEAGLVVDHVQAFEPPTNGVGIEREIERTRLVCVFCLVVTY